MYTNYETNIKEQTNLADFTEEEETEIDWDNLEFEEINNEVDTDIEKWIPTTPNDFIIGRYINTEKGRGNGEGLLFHILEDRNKKKHSILGDTVLNSKFTDVEYGTIVKIIYTGSRVSSKNREYKTYNFLVSKGN